MTLSARSCLVVAVVLAAACLAFSQNEPRQSLKKSAKRPSCGFSIIGLWKTNTTSQANPVYFQFLREGFVMLMGHTPNVLPQDFEQLDAVNYKLDDPSNPKVINITAGRGNDFFLNGTTPLKILELGEDTFTTLNPRSGEQTTWTREESHKHFIAFVAQSRAGPAFVIWTMMDGRETRIETLGVHSVTGGDGTSRPVFGLIPPALYDQIKEQTEEEKARAPRENVILRFELTGRDYDKTHKVFKAWEKLVKDGKLPAEDPDANAMALITQAANSLEPCGNFKLQRVESSAVAQITSQYEPKQRALEYIKLLKSKNFDLHLPDKYFPWNWRPIVQLPN